MRRPVVLAVVLLGLLAAIAVAQTQPPITVKVYPKVTPNRAGTPAHPQGVHLDVRLKIFYPSGYEPPLVDSIDVWFPKGGQYNGGRYPSCSYRRLNALGPVGCPKGSIMGHGSGVATADTNYTYPKITIVNGGQHVAFGYTVLNNPARVQTPVVGTITKLSGRWSYRLHLVIPKILQVVAGVPIVLHSIHLYGGRGDWLATTYCPPSQKWAYHAVTRFDDGQALVTDGTVTCRR
jgi:hypothetical protein